MNGDGEHSAAASSPSEDDEAASLSASPQKTPTGFCAADEHDRDPVSPYTDGSAGADRVVERPSTDLVRAGGMVTRRRGSVLAASKTQAVFVKKLNTMVSTPSLSEYISWSEDGSSFAVYNPNQFAANVLPQFFKHSNFQSFVRQLNMYGYRKINDMFSDAQTSSSAKKLGAWEFQHSFFQRDRPDLFPLIKRKSSKVTAAGSNSRPPSPPVGTPGSSVASSPEPTAPKASSRGKPEGPRSYSPGAIKSKRQRLGWPKYPVKSAPSRSDIDHVRSPHETLRHTIAPAYSPSSFQPDLYTRPSFHPSVALPHPASHAASDPRFAADDVAGHLAGLEHQVQRLTHAVSHSREKAVVEKSATTTALRILLRLIAGMHPAGERRDEAELAHAAIAYLETEVPQAGQRSESASGSGQFPPAVDFSRQGSTSRAYHSVTNPSYFYSYHRPAESMRHHSRSEHEDAATPFLSNGGSFSTVSSEDYPGGRPISARSPTVGSFAVLPRSGGTEAAAGRALPLGTDSTLAPSWGLARLPPLASIAGVGEKLRSRAGDDVNEGGRRPRDTKPWEL